MARPRAYKLLEKVTLTLPGEASTSRSSSILSVSACRVFSGGAVPAGRDEPGPAPGRFPLVVCRHVAVGGTLGVHAACCRPELCAGTPS